VRNDQPAGLARKFVRNLELPIEVANIALIILDHGRQPARGRSVGERAAPGRADARGGLASRSRPRSLPGPQCSDTGGFLERDP
jgi:hypothetical protein